ncbi:MAG: glycosyltransferase family 4 protein [Candidatus Krumholzibacteria bacterium]|nr:glycosyltransferase family 4 protein [Candidatus Krumholzibacteria bacterium]
MTAPSSNGAAAAPGILFFGGYDPAYPRNAVIRKGWAKCGFASSECRAGTRLKVHLRYPALLWRYVWIHDSSRVVFVPDFRHKDVPLAWAIARCTHRHLVFDPLVSRYETRVLDREDVSPGSAQERHNRNLDRTSMKLADLVLADTGAHARFYASEFSVPGAKIKVLPVGFDEDKFVEAPFPDGGGACSVLFYGTYLPLHGVETIVEAAAILRDAPVTFVLVGGGQTLETARSKARGLPGGKITFRAPVSEAELGRLIAHAHIVLGIFGTTPKARLVVPNKVYQALAVGRALITAETPAIGEIFKSGVHLDTVPPGDASALAGAIASLMRDPARMRRLADAGGSYVRSEFNSRRIAEKLFAILEEERFL